MINQQHKEEVNHVKAADCEKCEQMCKNEQEYKSKKAQLVFQNMSL